MEQAKIRSIVHCVQKHLQDCPLESITLTTEEDDTYTEDGWLHVRVHPNRLPDRLYRLDEFLVDVNLAIQEEFGRNILLVLSVPLQTQETSEQENRNGPMAWARTRRTKQGLKFYRTRAQAAAVVQRYLDAFRNEGATLDGDILLCADEQGVILGKDNWVRVPVRPSREPKRYFVFAALLADINQEINEKEHYNFILMTGDPLDDADTVAPAASAALVAA